MISCVLSVPGLRPASAVFQTESLLNPAPEGFVFQVSGQDPKRARTLASHIGPTTRLPFRTDRWLVCSFQRQCRFAFGCK
jgi:hypothetical protein